MTDPSRPVVARPVVGNDVVDLADPRCIGRYDDRRFLTRIFTEAEREAIEAAAEPDLALWLRWAAKEAAFKAATILRGAPPIFAHRRFEVEAREGEDLAEEVAGDVTREMTRDMTRERTRDVTGDVTRDMTRDMTGDEGRAGGVVRWKDETFRWSDVGVSHPSGEAVHVVCRLRREKDAVRVESGSAHLAPSAGVPLERFTDRECSHLHSPASAWVRLHARAHLARFVGVAEEELEIVCEEGPAGRSPPIVLHRGALAPWTVSLSHHGSLLGWLVARDA